jgi:hypothetical protein
MLTRRRTLVLGLFLVLALLGAPVLDAGRRRARARQALGVRTAAARVLGMPDLVLSSSSRWLRHPSQAEPGAPFADVPASLDTDPGGAVVGPPHELLGGRP